MAQAKRDGNFVPTIIGVDHISFDDPTTVAVDSSTHEMLVKASGTVTVTGVATSANQTNGSQKTQIVGSSGEVVTVKDLINSNPLTTAIVDGNGDQITSFGGGTQYTEGDTDATITGTPMMFETNTGTNALGVVNSTNKLPVDGSGVTQPISAASLPLPTGASTSAKQDTGNTSLGTIAGAVSGTEMQVDVLTMPTITVQATNLDIRDLTSLSDSVEVKQATGTNLHVVVDSAPTTAVTGTFWQATQPVSGTVTANLSATDNAVLDNIDTSTASYYITGIGHGVKTVTTAGTDVALATSTPCKRVDIQAQLDNTSTIAVGGSGVDATVATGTGIVLNPGDVYSLEIDNLADVFIDSLINGEGCRFTYYT